jgi:hypothetical protein
MPLPALPYLPYGRLWVVDAVNQLAIICHDQKAACVFVKPPHSTEEGPALSKPAGVVFQGEGLETQVQLA